MFVSLQDTTVTSDKKKSNVLKNIKVWVIKRFAQKKIHYA